MLKYIAFFLLIFIITSCNSVTKKDSEIVYINSQDDFEEYKNAEFQPGTHILFASGKSFNGQFAPSGSGTLENPIRVSSYNSETGEIYQDDTDQKAILNGQGAVNSTFYLYNGEYWEINNLEITNTNGSEEDQGELRGLYIVAEDFGIVNDVKVTNCYVHDVNGKVAGKKRGGIHIHVIGDKVKTKFHNLLIANNFVSRIGGVGIGNTSSWGSIHSSDFYPWTNFIIRGNRVEHTGRNGIIARVGYKQLVEYNTLAYNSEYSTGHSVFNFNTIDCIMQYNEAYGNTGEPGDIDHGGFDADYNARGTIIQYNYSHDNNWFCGIMRKFNRNITIRYNISINERLGAYMYGFPWEDNAKGIWIYNNTHYFKAGLNASIIASPGRIRTPSYTYFYNNIFYFEDSGSWGVEPDKTCEFSNNLFYNVAPKGKNAIVGDPMFINPGVVSKDIDMKNPDRLSSYRLKNNSPAIDAGLLLNENGGMDFSGKTLGYESIDLGAFEK